MSVPTVNVTCTVNDSEGNPVEGARVSAKLSTAEKYNGFVVPLTTNAVSDATGVAVLALFPNELGSESSEYAFKIMDPSTGKSIKFPAVIPNMDCNLFEIANVPPYPREYVGETFSKPVFDARDEVLAAKDGIEEAKTAAAQSEANALASEQNASQFAADAQQSKGEALTSATSASTSAGQAETAKVAAESARDAAVVAKGGAEAAQTVAETAQVGAVSAKDSAEASAASIPGLVDAEKIAAVAEVGTAKDNALAAIVGDKIAALIEVGNSKDAALAEIESASATPAAQAREIGGQAYQSLLGFPCPPSLEIKAWNAKDNTNGVPDGFTFARASSATQTNAAGQIEAVGDNVLRHDYDPETGEYRGFLIEEQRTNLLLHSGDFTNVAWTKTRATVAEESSFYKVISDNSLTSNHFIAQAFPGGDVGHVFWVDAVAQEWDHVNLSFQTTVGLHPTRVFDLTNGETKTSTSGASIAVDAYGMIPLSNGVYRCWIYLADCTGVVEPRVYISTSASFVADGDGVSGVGVFRSQLEQGSFPTSYIPTTTAAATRAADNLSIATADFPYKQSEGTVFADFDVLVDGPQNQFVCSVGLNQNTIDWFMNGSTAPGVVSAQYGGGFLGLDASELRRLAASSFSVAGSSTSLSLDGVVTSRSFSGQVPAPSILNLGFSFAPGGPLNGHIRHFAYFPRRLSNEQLQTLTR